MGRGSGTDIKASSTATRTSKSVGALQEHLAAGQPILRLLTIQKQANRFDTLIRQLEEGELDLNPPYQRDHVWGEERRRNLIRSLTMGLPIGAIFINSRDIMEPEVVLDGKQRIETVAPGWPGKSLLLHLGSPKISTPMSMAMAKSPSTS
jgi:hypothetical protein